MFFGRTDLFNYIAEEVEQLQQRVLILVGQRRTGKTSALLRLGQHLPAHLIPIYIDCQSLGVLPGMTQLFQDLAWLIADALDERDIELDVPDLETLQENPGKWFQQSFLPDVKNVLPQGSKILLVFDEFEAFENLVTDGILPRTFFPYLRHLMQHGDGLSFVFVGTHRLEEMSIDYWSVLFNIALYKEIGFLDTSAAQALITQPVAPHLIYDDLALDKMWRITAGHPYFLQLVCYSLVKHANAQETNYVTISDVNATVDEMLGLGEVHFAYIWQRSTPVERTVLIAIAHLLDKDEEFRPNNITAALADYDVHLPPPKVANALNQLVSRNILMEFSAETTPSYQLKLGIVGLWVERTKSLAKLHSTHPLH